LATPPQFVVLTMLRAYPGCPAPIWRGGAADPQTVSVIIRNLERDGAIRKTPHPVHGRVLQWTLTRRRDLLGQCRRHANALEQRLMAGVALEGTAHGPALAVQNCRRPAAGCWFQRVMTLPRPSPRR
jgi:DNA-binding MarR family transcriptional regulator